MNCALPICTIQRLRPSIAAFVGNRDAPEAFIFGHKGLTAGPGTPGNRITR